MAFQSFAFTKSWRNAQDFPTYEEEERQVREDLQCLHDETKDGLNRLIDQLNDPQAAAHLPFAPQDGLTAGTVQDAILEVYDQIRQAAAGLLVDGTVTKEKLAESLMERVYGGRVVVAQQRPDAAHCPETDYPLGQLWLRPGHCIENLMKTTWETVGCTMEASADGWKMASDGETTWMTASQSLEAVGQAGDRTVVYVDVRKVDSRLSMAEVCLNGVEYEITEGGGAFETALDQTGSLEIQLVGQWPYGFSDGAVEWSQMAAVNVEALERSLPGVQMPQDWAEALEGLLPFSASTVETALYQQTEPGKWDVICQKVLPVERGGTGLRAAAPGAMLYGGQAGLEVLEPPAEVGFLTCQQTPQWATAGQMAKLLGIHAMRLGSYVGTGEAGTVALPVTPKLLYIYPEGTPNVVNCMGMMTVQDNPTLLANGSARAEWWQASESGNGSFVAQVALSGATLQFSKRSGNVGGAWLCNRSGVTYHWIAIVEGESA